MEFRLLGPVEVHHEGVRLPAGSARERFVLAMLLLNPGRQVSTDFLVDRLWPDPPATAKAQLHNLVSKLRTRLHEVDDGLIVTRTSGYEFRLGEHRLDVAEFQALVADARRASNAGDHAAAANALDQALSLWRGAALTDVPSGLGADIRQGLAEERLAAAEAKLDAELALGRFDTVIREVQPLLAEHPYREHLYGRLMRALAGAGRRADALATYQAVYRRFADELGVEPGAGMRELEQRILRGEPATPVSSSIGRPIPRQLPPAVRRITGRERLLDTLTQAIAGGGTAGGVVVLVGPGGVGKTTLSLAAGHRLAQVFHDGQLYANLRGSQAEPADPHEVAGGFLRALGVDGLAVPEDRDERVAMYRSHLADRRLLIVLDDAASEAQVRPLLPGAGGSGVILTSRRQLAALMTAQRISVPELVDEAALGLLTEVAGRELVTADLDAARRIVDLCAGLPLAVCIAGARLAAQPDWDAAGLADRLAAERGRLDELAVGDLDVRASIALSYQALAADSARLFRGLGRLGAADWPAWVADAVCGAPAGDLLRELTDIHLVEPRGTDAVGQQRYRLHDLVAEYAAEQPSPSANRGDDLGVNPAHNRGDNPAHNRGDRPADNLVDNLGDNPAHNRGDNLGDNPAHNRGDDGGDNRGAADVRVLEGWLALASEADELIEHGMTSALGLGAPPRPALALRLARDTAFDWFETERANLLAAIERAGSRGDASLAARLALRIGAFLQLRAYDADRIRAYERAAGSLRQAADGGPGDLLLRVLSALFATYSDLADYAKMAEISERQLTLARSVGDKQRTIRALAQSGHTARVLGRLAAAAGFLDEAYDSCDAETPTQLVSTVMAYRASTFLDAGQPAEAEPWIGRAVAIERSHDRPLILAWRLMTQADVLAGIGRAQTAESLLQEAIQAAERVDDALTVASAEVKLANVEIALGQTEPAGERLRRALAVTEELGDAEMSGDALRSLGDLAVVRGEGAEPAAKPLRESLARWRRLGRPLEIARVLARLDRVLGEDDGAAYRTEWQRLLGELGLEVASLRLPPFYAQGL
ncbi:AfsR/SARP family transcriptional regulator [Flindersiella endophytica]